MSDRWDFKDPDDILDYQIDWSIRLGSDTIVTASWILPTGITMDSQSNTATTATIWLSGGTEGTTYRITSRVVTAAGRQMDHTMALRVSER